MDKRELLEALLEKGMVMVTLDSRRPGVDVPPRLAESEQLRLNLSYRFGLPLDVVAWGLHTTLTFGGIAHDCKIPWSAIYLIASHVTSEQFVFPEDIPGELLQAIGAAAEDEDEGEEDDSLPLPAPAARPRLTLVPTTPAPDEELPSREPVGAEAAEERQPPPGGGAGPSRAHLRRIK